MSIGTPIGTRVPHRHAVCRSHTLIHQGDNVKSAHFTTPENVPICADARIAIDWAAASIP